MVFGLLFSPVLAERFVKGKRREDWKEIVDQRSDHEALGNEGEEEEEAAQGRILGAIVRRYDWVLGHALDNRWAVLIVMVVVLAGSFLLYRSLGSEFLPEFDESAFVLDYWAPPGSSLTETDRILHRVEELLVKTPEIE